VADSMSVGNRLHISWCTPDDFSRELAAAGLSYALLLVFLRGNADLAGLHAARTSE
jgi:hypothetical protein